MKNGKPRKHKSDIELALLNSKEPIMGNDEYYIAKKTKNKINLCCFGCILPCILATILSITTGSSTILDSIEGMTTIIPPAERSIQITILSDGSILFPNGT